MDRDWPTLATVQLLVGLSKGAPAAQLAQVRAGLPIPKHVNNPGREPRGERLPKTKNI